MGQDAVQKGYDCAYQLHYHIVSPVKYRKALLSEAVAQAIKDIALGIQERCEVGIERIGCDRDHVHLLCSAHPKYAPGQLVGVFKSVTARELFKRFSTLKEELWGGEFWTDGYGVESVSKRGNWDVVEQYIRAQGMKPEGVQLRLF